MRFHVYVVLIQDIKELLEQRNVMMNHTLRERNQCVDFLAKLDASSNFEFLCHESPPGDLLNFLLSDAAGTFYLRECSSFFFPFSFFCFPFSLLF